MKAVIYARYSSDNQREESIEGQLRECKEYAEKNGITILRSYIDRALSAKTDNRPEFQKMVQDSAKGLFDTVLVWKLDRFARNRYDSAHYKAQLRKNGVKVVSATENISDGPEGIILESMLEGMAEYYSAELAQKINRGLRENALKGKNNGGRIPLGYQLGEDRYLKIDPLTAPIVREIYQRYAQGGFSPQHHRFPQRKAYPDPHEQTLPSEQPACAAPQPQVYRGISIPGYCPSGCYPGHYSP